MKDSNNDEQVTDRRRNCCHMTCALAASKQIVSSRSNQITLKVLVIKSNRLKNSEIKLQINKTDSPTLSVVSRRASSGRHSIPSALRLFLSR